MNCYSCYSYLFFPKTLQPCVTEISSSNSGEGTIECIFKTCLAVKRKHAEHVSGELSESKFLQSHHFLQGRIATGTKDILNEHGKINDQQPQNVTPWCSTGNNWYRHVK